MVALEKREIPVSIEEKWEALLARPEADPDDFCAICGECVERYTPNGMPLCDGHHEAFIEYGDKWVDYVVASAAIRLNVLPCVPCPECGKVKWSRIPGTNPSEIVCSACIPPSRWWRYSVLTNDKSLNRVLDAFGGDMLRAKRWNTPAFHALLDADENAIIPHVAWDMKEHGITWLEDGNALLTWPITVKGFLRELHRSIKDNNKEALNLLWMALKSCTPEELTIMAKRSPKHNTPAPMQLSHSQIENWEQCQYRWRLKKIDKVQAAPSESLIFGTALHAALEADGRQAMKGWAMVDYEMLGEFDRSMQEEIAKIDPYSLLPKARHIAMRARAQDIITRYIEKIQPTYKPLEIEKDFSIDLGAVQFRGRIDAVTATSILDWKTASSPWTPGEQDDKDQATAYLIARPEASKVSFAVFSGEGDSLRFQSLPTARTEAQKQEYRLKVLQIAEQIKAAKESGEFVANPGIGKGADGKWLGNCHRCEVLGACTAGQAWLKLKGRVPAVPVITPRAVEKYAESQQKADQVSLADVRQLLESYHLDTQELQDMWLSDNQFSSEPRTLYRASAFESMKEDLARYPDVAATMRANIAAWEAKESTKKAEVQK